MTKNVVKGLLFLGMFSLAVSVSAQDGEKKAKPAQTPEKMMKNYDTDKDGSISKSEAEANKNQGLFKKFDKVDGDKNGSLSTEELKKMIDKQAQGGAAEGKKGGKKAKTNSEE
ncbi:MAG: hypothetical protein KBE41_04805 [Lutibacter sp.]|nr:hypothetical protein [Lutibacter sp.]MBP9600804.1 hypothetical protein [Lutibacter sp.]